VCAARVSGSARPGKILSNFSPFRTACYRQTHRHRWRSPNFSGIYAKVGAGNVYRNGPVILQDPGEFHVARCCAIDSVRNAQGKSDGGVLRSPPRENQGHPKGGEHHPCHPLRPCEWSFSHSYREDDFLCGRPSRSNAQVRIAGNPGRVAKRPRTTRTGFGCYCTTKVTVLPATVCVLNDFLEPELEPCPA
jgi:hypothetical protein